MVQHDVIMENLVLNDTSHDYISPIHNFGYVYLTGDDYQRGLDICLSLLGQCDILVLCPEWESSRGCKGEFEYAKKHSISTFTLSEWKALNRI